MCKGLPSRYISANSLMFFPDQACPGFQADVLTCSLYAQLAASKKYSVFDQVDNWRSRYLDTLTHFRCPISYRSRQTFSVEAGETIWGCLVRELGVRVSPLLLEAADKTFIQISTDSDSNASTLLQAQSVRVLSDNPLTTEVSLQIGFAEVAPVVTLGFLSFKSTLATAGMPVAALLTQSGISEELDLTIISFELDDYDFGYFRDELIQRLGSKRDELIIRFPEVEP